MRKYITAAVVGTALLIGGCNSPTGENGIVVEQQPVVFVPSYVFSSQNRRSLPYPNDVWFAGSTDGTLNVPGTLAQMAPAGVNLASVNLMDGYSINATIRVPFSAPVDIATVKPYMPIDANGTPLFGIETNFWVLNTKTGIPLIPLIPPIPDVFPGTEAIAQYTVRVSAATDAGGKVLEIVPLKPLDPDTTYAFAITAGVADVDGNPLAADNEFGLLRDACFSGETLSSPFLEGLRQSPAVCPLLDNLNQLLGIPGPAMMVAWTVSTQSISNSLDVVSESTVAGVSALQFTGANTSVLNPALGAADIYAGFIDLPYYLDLANPYARGWQGAGGSNLSRYNPIPVVSGSVRAPMLMTLPNEASGQVKPAEGWPVMIFQHGITSSRIGALAIADAFASQGFAVIAIDLPLHGIPDSAATGGAFYVAPGNPAGILERHFYLDLFDNVTGAKVPDGIFDDGKQIFRVALQEPIVARDIFRQGVADMIQLARDIPVMDFEGAVNPDTGAPAPDGTPDFDGSRIQFVGHSMGAIVGVPFLGVQNEIATATIANGGGTLTTIARDPEAKVFGRPLVLGLQGFGIVPGTQTSDEYWNDFQHVMDQIEPISYAVAAAENSPVLLIEVIGDQAVPNSSTEKLASTMGVDTLTNGLTQDLTGIRGITRFTAGGHSSLLDPSSSVIDVDDGSVISAANPLATREMQTQAVMNAASNGVQIAVGTSGCNCVQ